MEDNYTLEGDADADSIYGGATDGGAAGFRRFLRLAQGKSALLPPWWTAGKANKRLQFGMRHGEWSELGCAIGKSDIIKHLGYAYIVTLVWGAGLWEGPRGSIW